MCIILFCHGIMNWLKETITWKLFLKSISNNNTCYCGLKITWSNSRVGSLGVTLVTILFLIILWNLFCLKLRLKFSALFTSLTTHLISDYFIRHVGYCRGETIFTSVLGLIVFKYAPSKEIGKWKHSVLPSITNYNPSSSFALFILSSATLLAATTKSF